MNKLAEEMGISIKSEPMKLLILVVSLFSILSSGCVSSSTKDTPPTPSPIITPLLSPTDTIPVVMQDKETVEKLEARIISLESQIAEIKDTMNYYGIAKPSDKDLIPEPPFLLKTSFKDNTSYFFRKDGIVEITEKNDIIPILANYELFHNNNTIKIYSLKGSIRFIDIEYDFYWLRLFDDYVTSIYENGWIQWTAKYVIKLNATSEWEKYRNESK